LNQLAGRVPQLMEVFGWSHAPSRSVLLMLRRKFA